MRAHSEPVRSSPAAPYVEPREPSDGTPQPTDSKDPATLVAQLRADCAMWAKRHLFLTKKNDEAVLRIQTLTRQTDVTFLRERIMSFKDQVASLRDSLAQSSAALNSERESHSEEILLLRKDLASEQEDYIASVSSDHTFQQVELLKRKVFDQTELMRVLRQQMVENDSFREKAHLVNLDLREELRKSKEIIAELSVKLNLQTQRAEKLVRSQANFLRKFRDDQMNAVKTSRDEYWSNRLSKAEKDLESERRVKKDVLSKLQILRNESKTYREQTSLRGKRMESALKIAQETLGRSESNVVDARRELKLSENELVLAKKSLQQKDIEIRRLTKRLDLLEIVVQKTGQVPDERVVADSQQGSYSGKSTPSSVSRSSSRDSRSRSRRRRSRRRRGGRGGGKRVASMNANSMSPPAVNQGKITRAAVTDMQDGNEEVIHEVLTKLSVEQPALPDAVLRFGGILPGEEKVPRGLVNRNAASPQYRKRGDN